LRGTEWRDIDLEEDEDIHRGVGERVAMGLGQGG
jgi:hypothetical protein